MPPLTSREGEKRDQDQTTADDYRLLKEIRHGNAEAFGELYDKYKDALYSGVILPRTLDRELAEDALQDVFVTALEKIGAFKWQGIGFFPWLKRIAVLKCKEVLRKSRKTAPLEPEIERILPDARNYLSPEGEFMLQELKEDLKQKLVEVLDLLNDRYREALELRLVKELPREECARRFGITINNFDVLFFRACHSFVKKYKELYRESPAGIGRLDAGGQDAEIKD